jgi:hypothetical protein
MNRSGPSDLQGLRWRDLALALVDLGRLVLWCVVAGLIGVGSGCCAGRVSAPDWMRANPPPRLRLVAELRLRHQAARGLRKLTEYLDEESAAAPDVRRSPERIGRRPSRQSWHRSPRAAHRRRP